MYKDVMMQDLRVVMWTPVQAREAETAVAVTTEQRMGQKNVPVGRAANAPCTCWSIQRRKRRELGAASAATKSEQPRMTRITRMKKPRITRIRAD